MTGRRLILAALVVALVQIGFLGWSLYGRAAILQHGREIALRIRPVDPRDLLRGDYVALSYDISTLPAELVRDAPPRDDREIKSMTVRVRPGADGLAEPVAVFLGAEPATPASGDEVDLKARASTNWRADTVTIPVTYGIERFYLPEGEGRPIENAVGERSFIMRVAVSSGGVPQIKALYDGETRLYAEPLY